MDDTGWLRFDPASRRLTLQVHVQPGSKTSGIAGMHGGALKIRIAAPAADNRANAALIDFLHRYLDLAPSRISILHGARGRRKVVEIAEAKRETHDLIRDAAAG